MCESPLVCDCNTQDLVDTLLASLPCSSLNCPYDIQMYFTLDFGRPQNIHARAVGVFPIVPLQIMLVLATSYDVLTYQKDDISPGDYIYIEMSWENWDRNLVSSALLQ